MAVSPFSGVYNTIQAALPVDILVKEFAPFNSALFMSDLHKPRFKNFCKAPSRETTVQRKIEGGVRGFFC